MANLTAEQEVEQLRERVKLLEAILQGSPCTCMSSGCASYPPQPSDYMVRHWCGRCRALGYDKNPESKLPLPPGFGPLVMS